jgi:uncharacterized protein
MRSRAVIVGGVVGVVVVGLLGVAAPAGAAARYPAPHGRCVDEAGVLGDALCAQVTAVLLRDEKVASDEIAVAVVSTTGDASIEAYSTGLFNAWGVGKRDKNNGVLLVVAVDDHRLRLETGRGIGSRLSDARAKHIVDTVITSKFKQGEHAAGVLAGLDEVRRALGHKVPATARLTALATAAPDTSAPQDDTAVTGPDDPELAPDALDAPSDDSGLGGLPSAGGLFCLAPFVLGGLLLAGFLGAARSRSIAGSGTDGWRPGTRRFGRPLHGSDNDSGWTSASHMSSFGSSDSSGGGFSGGGSDFGGGSSSGGGASGSW